MNSNIYIFSDPVQSGKTTLLMNFAAQHKNVAGILTPDISGNRKLYNVNSAMFYDLEVPFSENSFSIGKYNFSKNAFSKAREFINADASLNFDWLLIDEIGNLEIKQKMGLEPAISSVIKYYQLPNASGKLMVVVRDTLLSNCIKHYSLNQPTVINADFFKKPIYHNKLHFENTVGLIMCGGKSTRMGSEKYLLNYYGKPQCYHGYDLLKGILKNVYLSVNNQQAKTIQPEYQFIVDNDLNKSKGPMTGLLSAMEMFPGKSFFILGCDYPYIRKEHLEFFFSQMTDYSVPASFYDPYKKSEEPLLAFYPAASYIPLMTEFTQGKGSLKKFLQDINAVKIIPWNLKDLESVDTLETYQQAYHRINAILS